MSTVRVKSYLPPEYNRKEILRYTGAKKEDERINALIEECIDQLDGKLSFKVCYAFFPIKRIDEQLDLAFTTTNSISLRKNLEGADEIVLFVATIGVEIDRIINKYGKLSPLKALIFQAIGAERIESLCDLFASDVQKLAREKGKDAKPRFSAGYGDFPLEKQVDIFNALSPFRHIGASLNQSLLMSPSKTVSALIGLTGGKAKTCQTSCADCKKIDCDFRR